MDDLLKYLSQGKHKVVVTRVNSMEELQERIKNNFVLIKFTETRGGTELGLKLDTPLMDKSSTDLQNSNGKISLIGDLTLNYQKIKCFADIELSTLEGVGYIKLVE